MARLEATVRLFDLVESDAPTARREIERRLRTAGFTRWQVVSVRSQGSTTHVVTPHRRVTRSNVSYAGGGLLVAAVAAWTLWFLWLLAS
ncbi:MAG: hypothetical protein ACE5I7_09035 [Candidatus Binatia bacterium]